MHLCTNKTHIATYLTLFTLSKKNNAHTLNFHICANFTCLDGEHILGRLLSARAAFVKARTAETAPLRRPKRHRFGREVMVHHNWCRFSPPHIPISALSARPRTPLAVRKRCVYRQICPFLLLESHNFDCEHFKLLGLSALQTTCNQGGNDK